MTLPPDVAFRVGGDSGVDWLVLQVHYASVSHLPEEGDDTTVVVTHSTEPRPKTAGVLLMATGGRLPEKVVLPLLFSLRHCFFALTEVYIAGGCNHWT